MSVGLSRQVPQVEQRQSAERGDYRRQGKRGREAALESRPEAAEDALAGAALQFARHFAGRRGRSADRHNGNGADGPGDADHRHIADGAHAKSLNGLS